MNIYNNVYQIYTNLIINMSHPKINYWKNKIKEPIAHLIMNNDVDKLVDVITINNLNNIIDEEHRLTALHIAVITHANNVVKYLIELGADINIENKNKLNASELAIRYNNEYLHNLINTSS